MKIYRLELQLKTAQRERAYAQSKAKRLEEKKHISSNNIDALVKASKKNAKGTQKNAKVCVSIMFSLHLSCQLLNTPIIFACCTNRERMGESERFVPQLLSVAYPNVCFLIFLPQLVCFFCQQSMQEGSAGSPHKVCHCNIVFFSH